MQLSFGARLRLQRERLQLDIAAIAAQMKIKASLLDELEHDDVSHWPSGIYRRAYLRDYARAIGLDPEPAVREFMELHPDPMFAAAQPEPGGDDSTTPHPEASGFRRLLGAMPAVLRRARSEPESVGLTISRLLASAPQGSRVVPAASLPVAAVSIDEPLSEAADFSGDPPEDMERAGLDLDSLDVRIAVVPAPPAATIDLAAVADVCTRLARATSCEDVLPVLADAARLLHAVGLVVWSWDTRTKMLTPALAHGYLDAVLERLPSVRADAPNAIAAAFRSASPHIVDGTEDGRGAVAVPLMVVDGCAGVLAVEVEGGHEHDEPIRAVAQIIAAQLATLLVVAPAAAAASA